jgi:hypothetical protein
MPAGVSVSQIPRASSMVWGALRHQREGKPVDLSIAEFRLLPGQAVPVDRFRNASCNAAALSTAASAVLNISGYDVRSYRRYAPR